MVLPPQDVQGTTVESIESRPVSIIFILPPQDRTSVGKEYDSEQTVNPTTTEIRNFCELTGEKSSNIPRAQDLSPDRNLLTKFGIEYGIPLPWPQDRPADDKSQKYFMMDDRSLGKVFRLDRLNFVIEYGVPLPRPQDRPP